MMNKFKKLISSIEILIKLSFPNDDEYSLSLGDVFINRSCYFQSNEYGHNVLREMAFLAVHGYLHLLGYDHETKEQEQIMFKIQEEILVKENRKGRVRMERNINEAKLAMSKAYTLFKI